MTQTIEQLQARVRELEEENARLNLLFVKAAKGKGENLKECFSLQQQLAAAQEECEFQRNAHKQAEELMLEQSKQLAAAQEEILIERSNGDHWRDAYSKWVNTDESARRLIELQEQLAKAEQRVAELIPGNGKELSERMKRLATNSVWRYSVAQNKPVDMSDPNIQELFAIIDHLCIGLDSPANGASS